MNLGKFQIAEEAFLSHMKLNSSENRPFENFNHDFLCSDEIDYKTEVRENAIISLQLSNWEAWKSNAGLILEAVRTVCFPQISANLLEHRYGTNGSYKALYRVETNDEIVGLENTLYDFFLGGDTSRDIFGPRFDKLANYLRSNKLGCNWAFVAYLSFLADARRYFPILPSKFDALLEFYEIPIKLSGFVSWQKYLVLLELADEHKEILSKYGPTDIIGIQSYMWVVAALIKDGVVGKEVSPNPIDFEEELNRRQRAAKEKERIGFEGEIYVVKIEQDKLLNAGCNELARKVQLVSKDTALGFDVLSFEINGDEMHIEVKTTARTRETDVGFWLSDNERNVALEDDSWCLYRVRDIDVEPNIENLGNIVRSINETWELKPSTWRVCPKL